MKNDVMQLAKSVKLIRAGKSEGGELKDPTKRAAFASLFTPREANLPATVVSPAQAPATPEENTSLANRSPSKGPASAENPDLIAKATQTLMEAPVTRRKFLETSRNAVAAANQAGNINKLLKPTEIAKAVAKEPMGEGATKFLIRLLLTEPVNIHHPIVKGLLDYEEDLYPEYSDVDPGKIPGMEHLNPDEATEELIQSNPRRAIDLIHGAGDTVAYMDPELENEIYERTHAHIKSKFEYLMGEKISDEEYKNLVSDAENNYSGNGDFIDDKPAIKKSEGGELELRRAKMAKKRAGGQQLPPSVFMPNVPRQVRAEGGLIHKESGGRISKEQQLFINYLKKHYPDGIILHHETPGHEGRSIRENKLQGGYGVFASIDAPSNFVTSKDKTTTKFRVPASEYENISPDMGYGGNDEGSTHDDPFIDFMNKHPNPKGAYVGTSYEEIPDRWVKEIKETHDDGPKYFSEGGLIHKESGGGLAARRAEAQAYIKDLIEQRNLYTKGSPNYDFYTKQIAEQGKIVAQKAEPERSVGMGRNQPPEETATEKLDRNYNALGLYSKAAEAARSSKQDEMKLEEWTKFLKNQPGVKKEELEWGLKRLSNIKPFPLDGEPEEDPSDKKFSKEDIASAFEDESLGGYKKSVRSNNLREKYMKDPSYYHNNWEASHYYDRAHAAVMAEEMSKDPKAIEHYFSKFGYDKDDIDEIIYNFKRGQDYNDTFFQDKGYSDAQLEKERTDWAANYWAENYKNELRSIAGTISPKWTKYQLSEEKEGVAPLENYREIIPQYRPEEKERFKYETHFPEKNPLFHLRLGDRKTPDGKKILEVVEAQSDASQQGRGKFLNDETHQKLQDEYASLNQAYADAYKEVQEALEKQEELHNEFYAKIRDTQGQEAASQAMFSDYPGTEYPKLAMKIDILSDRKDKIRQELEKTSEKLKNVIPEYPHVASSNATTNLMIKQILHEVAAGDYDGVTVNHGPTQADRWPSKEGKAVGNWYDTTFIPKLYDAMKSHDPETLHYGPKFVPRNLEDKDGEPVLDPKTNEPIDLWKTKGLSETTPTNKGFSVSKDPIRDRQQTGLDYYFNDNIYGYGNDAPARMQLRQDVQNWHHQQRPDVHESPEAVRVTGNAIVDYLEGNNIPFQKKDEQPMIEASPTAKASILKNQTLYKRGGRIGYDYGGDVRTGDNPGGAADANRPAATSRDADRNYNAGSGTQTAGPSGDNRPDNRPDNSNDRFNIGGGGAPMPPQRGDDSFFGNMGGNIGSVLGGLALGPIGSIGGRYLGNQFNQPDNSRFETKNDEFGNPVGGGWLDFLGNSGSPPAPMTSDNRRDPIVQPRKPRRRVLMPDGTYQEVEEYKSGGEVKSPIAKKTKKEHNSPIVEVALSKIRSLPRGSDYPSRGMRGRP
jgi:hypothetical protein